MIETTTVVRFTNEYDKVMLELNLTDQHWSIENGNDYEMNTLVSLADLVMLKEDLEDWIEQKKKEVWK